MAEKIEIGKEKVTWMKLTTKPLDNHKNFTKVKKALCCLPQIRDQVFDEKSKTTVTIKVVCCSPGQVMNKLCKKGGGYISTIEIIDPPKSATQKPKDAEKPNKDEKIKEAEKPKETEKPKEKEKPKPAPAAPTSQTYIYGHYPGEPVMYHVPQPYTGWGHPNGYPERPVYDSYHGGPPPPSYYGESPASCSIM